MSDEVDVWCEYTQDKEYRRELSDGSTIYSCDPMSFDMMDDHFCPGPHKLMPDHLKEQPDE